MDLASYGDYIALFNRADPRAFDRYMSPHVLMINGNIQMRGIEAVREHYQQRIWPFFSETVQIGKFVSDAASMAIRMCTQFTAIRDAETIFGSVKIGHRFEYRGVVFYDLEPDGRFSCVEVCYTSFTSTDLLGERKSLGIPH